MREPNSHRIVFLALVLALAVGACGGGGGSSGDNLDDYLPSGPGSIAQPPSGPPSSNPPPSGGGGTPALTFRVIASGTASLITTTQNRVARDQAAWNSLWNEHLGAQKPPLPAVDFASEIVVGVFLGTRPTGGYTAGVLAVEAEGAGAKVSFEERQPGQNCITTQALTQPFVLVAITRVEGAISFSGKVTVVNCP